MSTGGLFPAVLVIVDSGARGAATSGPPGLVVPCSLARALRLLAATLTALTWRSVYIRLRFQSFKALEYG